MIFGIFENWNKKTLKHLKKSMPYIETLYVLAALTNVRVNNLCRVLAISKESKLYYQLSSFYLGTIEGDIRKTSDMSNMPQQALMEAIFLVAAYTAIMNKEINNDHQWAALAAQYEPVLLDGDNDWFRKQGLSYAGLSEEDPENEWKKLVNKISD